MFTALRNRVSPVSKLFSPYSIATPEVRHTANGSIPVKNLSVCIPATSSVHLPAHRSLIVYIGSRPFVLRDAAEPRQNLQFADRAETLEAAEQRLKDDILAEAAKYVFHYLRDRF